MRSGQCHWQSLRHVVAKKVRVLSCSDHDPDFSHAGYELTNQCKVFVATFADVAMQDDLAEGGLEI